MRLPSLGERLGPWTLESVLGKGSMGAVYLGLGAVGEARAIKVPLFEGEDAAEERARFEREVEVLARIPPHPNVVRIHAAGEDRGTAFAVLELVEGKTLESLLLPGPLPVERALAIGACVASALAHLHAHGVVHRDLKPRNVLLREDGSAVLVDFGIARDDTLSRLTETGTVLGTPDYMSPEQTRSAKDLGPPSDAHALGALLYALLTGRPPFRGSGFVAISQRIVRDTPPPPSAERREVTPEVDALVLSLLAKTPSERPTAAAALEAIRALRARPAPPRRSRAPVAVAALAIVALVAVALRAERREGTPPRASEPPTPARMRSPPRPWLGLDFALGPERLGVTFAGDPSRRFKDGVCALGSSDAVVIKRPLPAGELELEGSVALWVRTRWSVEPNRDWPAEHDDQGLFTYAAEAWRDEVSLFFWRHHALVLIVSTAPGTGEPGDPDRVEVKCDTTLGAWPAESWHHVAGTWSAGKRRLSLHMDGERVSVIEGARIRAFTRGRPASIVVGAHAAPTASVSGLDGDVKSVSIFDRALEDGEVEALYRAPR